MMTYSHLARHCQGNFQFSGQGGENSRRQFGSFPPATVQADGPFVSSYQYEGAIGAKDSDTAVGNLKADGGFSAICCIAEALQSIMVDRLFLRQQ
jgi:hypothetical protein